MAEIVQPRIYIENFPLPIEREVRRDNAIESVKSLFENGNSVVLVDGEQPSIGKTIFLAQYVEFEPRKMLALFLNPTSAHGYSPDLARLQLYEQGSFMLDGVFPRADNVSEQRFNELLVRMRRLSKLEGPITFVVDGLDHVPAHGVQSRLQIIQEVLPVAFSEFRFLISGGDKIRDLLHPKTRSKVFTLIRFSAAETGNYLEDIVNKSDIQLVQKEAKGNPGMIASIKRSIIAGMTLDDILRGKKSELSDFIRLECLQIDTLTREEKALLAIPIFALQRVSPTEVASIAGEHLDTTIEKLKDSRVFKLVEAKKELEFVSDAHHRYLKEQLGQFSRDANQKLLDQVLRQVDSNDTIEYAPAYFMSLQRHSEFLKFLNEDRLLALANRVESRSLTLYVLNQASAASGASRNLQAHYKFVTLTSAVQDLTSNVPLQSELRSLVAIKSFDAALRLALSPHLNEDKLRLLALYGKLIIKSGKSLEPAIREQIEGLVNLLALDLNSETTIEIVADLAAIDPQLAFALLDSSKDKDEMASDIAYAAVSMVTAQESPDGKPNNDSANFARVRNAKLQSFASALSAKVTGVPAARVLERAEALRFKDRLYLLSRWLRANQTQQDADQVISFALDAVLSEQSHTPTLAEFRDFALPLRHLKSEPIARALVARLDGQKGTAKKHSPSEDYLRFELLLAEAVSKFDVEAAHDRLLDLYLYVQELSEKTTQTDCVAWFIARLPEIDVDQSLEKLVGLGADLEKMLSNNWNTLLTETASHYDVFEGSIAAISAARPALALGIASRLNMQHRRDDTYALIVNTIVSRPTGPISLVDVVNASSQIVGKLQFSETVHSACKELASRSAAEPLLKIEGIEKLAALIFKVTDSYSRSSACVEMLCLLNESKFNDAELFEKLTAEIAVTVESIDYDWLKLDVLYRTVEATAQSHPDTAQMFLALAQETKLANSYALGDLKKNTLLKCLLLCRRVLNPLIVHGLHSAAELDRVDSLLRLLGSHGERAVFWGDIIVNAALGGNLDDANAINGKYLVPAIAQIPKENHDYYERVAIRLAPANYLTQRALAIEEIERLSPASQEKAALEIIQAYVRRLPSAEPYEAKENSPSTLNESSLAEVFALGKYITTDVQVYSIVINVVSAIGKKGLINYTREQRADVIARLREFYTQRLPDPKNIEHEGFLIVCDAKLHSLENPNNQNWEPLLARARALGNISDVGFCLTAIAAELPSRYSSLRADVVKEAFDKITAVPSILDRCERFEILSSSLESAGDKVGARQFLKAGMEQSLQIEDGEKADERQLKLIDIMNRVDPAWATEYASKIDSDPVRSKKRIQLAKRLRENELKKDLEAKCATTKRDIEFEQMLPAAAWSRLKKLNAHTAVPVQKDFIFEAIRADSSTHLSEIYPLLALSLESSARREITAAGMQRTLHPIFTDLLTSTEVFARIQSRAAGTAAQFGTLNLSPEDSFFSAGEREQMMAALEKWIESQEELDRVRICDPYFGPDDLWVARILYKYWPGLSLDILTSFEHLDKIKKNDEGSFSQAFRNECEGAIDPTIRVVVCGFDGDGKSPVHDRWMVGKESGLRLGSSFNGIGKSRLSEISNMDEASCNDAIQKLDPFLNQRERMVGGTKLKYRVYFPS